MKKMSCRMILLTLLLCFSAIMAGCGRKTSGDKKQTSLGVDNGVAGFLFHFDTREETAKMVRNKGKGEYPVKLRWAYSEKKMVDEKPEEYSSEDAGLIREIYYALSNTIIMGNAFDHSEETPFYVELELADGSICRYEFVSLNTIRLSRQNYVIESDGNLWQAISKASEELSDNSHEKDSQEES